MDTIIIKRGGNPPKDKKRFLESLVPNGITIFIHPSINKRLIPENVVMEIVYNSDIFEFKLF